MTPAAAIAITVVEASLALAAGHIFAHLIRPAANRRQRRTNGCTATGFAVALTALTAFNLWAAAATGFTAVACLAVYGLFWTPKGWDQ